MSERTRLKNKVEAESLLAKSRGPAERKTKPSTLPGSEVGFLFVSLTGDEIQLCRSRAFKRFADLAIPVEHRYQIDFDEEVSWQILFESMRDPENPHRYFARDTDEVRRLFSDEEREVMVDEQLDHQELQGPDVQNLTPALAAAVLEDVKKKDLTALSNYASRSLRYFLRILGEQPEVSQISKSSILSFDITKLSKSSQDQ